MSVSREVIAGVSGVAVDDVECQKCRYGDGGKVLVWCENPFYGHIVVAGGSYCSFWKAERSEYERNDYGVEVAKRPHN